MPAYQALLFPDPRPLVERLGRDFFRRLPEDPGVYLMRDAADAVLYVGKARNLRKRLGSYRVANPDRLPRRHLRLLRAVVRIELELCPDEAAALARESELLRALHPRFNRAGTWPVPPRYVVWHPIESGLELGVTEAPCPDGHSRGPLGGGAPILRAALARLLWLALHPDPGISGLPAGWFHGKMPDPLVVPRGAGTPAVVASLDQLFRGQTEAFGHWIRAQMPDPLQPFAKALLEADLECVTDAFTHA